MPETAYKLIGQRIRQARQSLGLGLEAVADYLGSTTSTLSRYESGKVRIPTSEVVRIARYLSVDAGWLLTGEGQPARERSPQEIIRELEARVRETPIMVRETLAPVSAGGGTSGEAEAWPYLPTPTEREHTFIAVRVTGTCMEPEIMEGHRVIVDMTAAPEARPGDLVVARVDGEELVKVLERRTGRLWLVALQDQPPIEVTDQVEIVGIVRTATYRPKPRR